MKSRWCSWSLTSFTLLLAVVFMLNFAPIAAAEEMPQQVQPQPQQPQAAEPQEIDAQMVRLSYMEGDVRLSRAILNRDDLKKGWETATANTAIEEGFGLATGSHGRAEIEFENGSVAYLAENSVLMFDTLETIDNVPLTRLKLMTGTVSLSTKLVEEEQFIFMVPGLMVPGDEVKIPNGALIRADSYLDGFVVTPMRESSQGVIVYRDGKFAKAEGTKPLTTPVGWNEWVLARQQARDAVLPEAMKAAGVSSPFPGLMDLYQNGRFFPCDPYGRCWVPVKERTFTVSDCWNGERGIQETTLRDINTGQKRKERELLWANGPWLPCNYGSWIDYDMGYAWVFDPWMMAGYWPSGGGHRHHRHHDHDGDHHRHHPGGPGGHPGGPGHHPGGPGHHPRGHWVKTDGKTGFVPRHPKDVDGKPPVNLKNGIFVFKHKDHVSERVNVARTDKLKLLDAPPRELRKIERAEQRPIAPPPIRARLIEDEMARAGTGTTAKPAPRLIDYDYHSKKFVDRSNEGRHEKPTVVGEIDRKGRIFVMPHRDASEQQGAIYGKYAPHPHDADSNTSNRKVFDKENRRSKVDSTADRASSGSVDVTNSNNNTRPRSSDNNASRGDRGSRDHGWGRHGDSGSSNNSRSSGSYSSSDGSISGSGRHSGSGSSSGSGGSRASGSSSSGSSGSSRHSDSGSSSSSGSGRHSDSGSSSGWSGGSRASGSSSSGSSGSSRHSDSGSSSSSGSSHASSSGSYGSSNSGGSNSSSSSSSSSSSAGSGGRSSDSGGGGGNRRSQ